MSWSVTAGLPVLPPPCAGRKTRLFRIWTAPSLCRPSGQKVLWCNMTNYCIRNVTPADLDAVAAVEAACFPPAEAASREAFAYRIAVFPERFFVAETEDRIIGIINGCASNLPLIEDALFEPQGHEPDGMNQMIFGLAVLPEFQRQGIAAALMQRLIDFAKQSGMKQVILTCKEQKIAYYSKFGFENRGISGSVHGGSVWYDMILTL